MFNEKLTRKTFLKGSAAAAALAGTGALSFGTWQSEQAIADEEHTVTEAYSLCNGCSSKCGLVATLRDGKLWQLRGHENHPYSKGAICGRGHAFAQLAYSEDRLTQPLKRTADGSFEPISWDTAFAEIGEKTKAIIASDGPEALSMIHDPRPSGKFYADRFMKALGSANVYTHAAACNLSNGAAYTSTIGSNNYSLDMDNAKVVMFIGRSYGDGIRPSSVASIAKAAERGCKLIIVDPRLNNTGVFATDWVPVKPGTDIALLLGMCNVLITEDLYDKEFIAEHTVGFEEFAAEVADFTPEWAESICEIPAEKITELAHTMAEAAPAALVEASWRAVIGCSYLNSFDTARVMTAVNALLGNWGQKGGALINSTPKPGDIDENIVPPIPEPESPKVGKEEFPLALGSTGTNLAALKAALNGEMKGMFFYNSNAVRSYGQPKVWKEGLENLELSVCIDIQMSETAMCCDYVLPDVTYLERLEVPDYVGGKKHFVCLRDQVIEKIHPDTKPCDEIFVGLAEACGVGHYFPFTIEEYCEAELATLGISLAELRAEGIIELENEFEYKVPTFKTETEKFQFVDPAVGEAGLSSVITYTATKVDPGEGEFRLIGGKQGHHSHTMTGNVETLHAISKEYDLERPWISVADAKRLGIEDGDLVEISSSEHSAQTRIKVTERLKSGVIFLPSHYGGASPDQTKAYEFGIGFNEFVPFDTEPAVGSMMSQEVIVTVRKVGA